MNFSVRVIKEALLSHGDKKNMVSSPLSIAAILNFLAVGSKGRTLDQFLHILGSQTLVDVITNYPKLAAVAVDTASSDEHGDIHDSSFFQPLKLSEEMASKGNQFISKSSSLGPSISFTQGPLINFVNGAWVNQFYSLKHSFERVLKSDFNVETRSLNFQNKREAITEINSWVKKATKGLIHETGCSDAINKDALIVLANALYFKGTWQREFDPSRTKDLDFYLVSGEKVLVPFMRGNTSTCYFYRSFDTFKVAKLPYKSRVGDQRRFSMHLFLPNEKDGLPKLLQEFSDNPNLFLNEKLAVSMVELELMIPKFKFSYGFEVSKFIKGLGLELGELTEIIEDGDENAASFDGVVIFQEARIIVNEGGTEAAALSFAGRCRSPPPRPSFVADHPFMFMIREDNSGTPIFVGLVVNPLMD